MANKGKRYIWCYWQCSSDHHIYHKPSLLILLFKKKKVHVVYVFCGLVQWNKTICYEFTYACLSRNTTLSPKLYVFWNVQPTCVHRVTRLRRQKRLRNRVIGRGERSTETVHMKGTIHRLLRKLATRESSSNPMRSQQKFRLQESDWDLRSYPRDLSECIACAVKSRLTHRQITTFGDVYVFCSTCFATLYRATLITSSNKKRRSFYSEENTIF